MSGSLILPFLLYFYNDFTSNGRGRILPVTAGDRFWQEVLLYVGHHGWPTKKILCFWWSKKTKTTLQTIRFWQSISIRIFKFSPFLYTMKACQWNLIYFSKFANASIRKEKKKLMKQSMRKKKLREVGLCFITGCFIKSFNRMINRFFVSQPYSQPNFCYLISEWRKKGKYQ